MADTLESTGNYLPKDLRITAQPDAVDKDKFQVTATGLQIDSNYIFQFQYVFEDNTLSEWSPGYILNTTTETVPGAPNVTVPSTAIGGIPVTLLAFPANAKRVDIYVIGGEYGTGKVADYFLSAGTKVIPAVGGVYQVSLITVSPSGINGDPTGTFTITVSNVVIEDTAAPDPIVSAVATAGPHPQDPSATLGYINLAITNGTIPTDFNGYIVKITGPTNSWTQDFKSTTALSNLYLTGGLFVGQTYSLSVATTDGKNVSSYINSTPSSILIADSRINNSTVVGSLSFSATDSILTVSWTASTDPYVDSYRVQLTSNLDTTFSSPLQTIYSKGTTATFGGLDSNTTYRVRVTTKYSGANGTLSSNHTSGTFTLDSSGAISDGIAPTTNPALTSSMVKPLFKAFAITFPPIVNSDAVVYEVFIKPDSSSGIVSSAYKVLEISGTFAVVRTLADKITTLSYGTNYYIAIRAKDNDGVSTGVVTAVGPIQTEQVSTDDLANLGITEVKIDNNAITAAKIAANAVTETKIANDSISSPKIIAGAIETDKIAAGAIVADKISANAIEADKIAANAITATKIAAGAVEAVAISANAITAGKIAADAVLANNIKAGEIDATKLTADTILAEQKITVGSNSALDRIRLDATNATISGQAVSSRIYIGGGNYYDTASPFYADNLGRLSIGQKLKFENGELTVNGKGTFTGTVTAGTGTTVVLGNNVQGDNDGIYISATGDYIYSDGTIRLGNGGITYASGLLTVTGNIIANALSANATIESPIITGGTYQTSITVGDGSSNSFGVKINTSGIFGYPANSSTASFTLNNTGVMTANSGTIGGWTINPTQLSSTAGNSGQIALYPLTANGGKIALIYGGVEKITIDPVEGIVGPSITVAGNTGAAFKITPGGTAEFRGTIYAANGIFSGTVSGATIQTSNSSYIRMDAASPSEIQLHANGFTYDGTIDFGGGTSNGKPFGSLVIQPPSNAPYFKPSISLDDANGLSLESYNKIYFTVNRPVAGTNNTSEVNVFAYMEQYGAEGAKQGRFNFEANIPVADKSFRPIFAGTSSLPDALYPSEEIGSIYLEY